LDDQERATFENYVKILGKRELTVADIKEFCAFQLNKIETIWSDMKVDRAHKAELIAQHTVYKTLLKAVDAPELERVALEQVLQQQLTA
jgi:hypothetical protein